MGRYCCVRGCHSYSAKDQHLSFHNIPAQIRYGEARKRWIEKIRAGRVGGRGKDCKAGQPWQPGKQAGVCSLHFVDGRPSISHPDPELFLNGDAHIVAELFKKTSQPKIPETAVVAEKANSREEQRTHVSGWDDGREKCLRPRAKKNRNTEPKDAEAFTSNPGVKRITIPAPDGGQLTMMVPEQEDEEEEEDHWSEVSEGELAEACGSAHSDIADILGSRDPSAVPVYPTEDNFSCCSACVRGYRDVSQLQNHLLMAHSKTPEAPKEKRVSSPGSYECEICSKLFSVKKVYAEHLQGHFVAAGAKPVKMKSILIHRVTGDSQGQNEIPSVEGKHVYPPELLGKTLQLKGTISQNSQQLSSTQDDKLTNMPQASRKPVLQSVVKFQEKTLTMGKNLMLVTGANSPSTENKGSTTGKKIVVYPINAIQSKKPLAPGKRMISLISKPKTVGNAGKVATSNSTQIETSKSGTTVPIDKILTGGNVVQSGNAKIGNVVQSRNDATSGNVVQSGNTTSENEVQSESVVQSANIATRGNMVQSANITSGNVVQSANNTSGNVAQSGNITSGKVVQSGNITSGNVVQSGNITSGKVVKSGHITTNANVSITSGNSAVSGSVATSTNMGNGAQGNKVLLLSFGSSNQLKTQQKQYIQNLRFVPIRPKLTLNTQTRGNVPTVNNPEKTHVQSVNTDLQNKEVPGVNNKKSEVSCQSGDMKETDLGSEHSDEQVEAEKNVTNFGSVTSPESGRRLSIDGSDHKPGQPWFTGNFPHINSTYEHITGNFPLTNSTYEHVTGDLPHMNSAYEQNIANKGIVSNSNQNQNRYVIRVENSAPTLKNSRKDLDKVWSDQKVKEIGIHSGSENLHSQGSQKKVLVVSSVAQLMADTNTSESTEKRTKGKHEKTQEENAAQNTKNLVEKAIQKPNTYEDRFLCKPSYYRCDVCPKKYDRLDLKKMHMKREHFPNYWLCDFCDYLFPTLTELDEHKTETHLNEPAVEPTPEEPRPKKKKNKNRKKYPPPTEKKHLCDLCGYATVYRYQLRVHKETHTGEKNYTCDICGKKFTTASCCAAHRKRHSEERTYACTKCPKAFKDWAGLKQHLMFHNDDRPFPCDICGRSFHTRQNTRTHRLRHFKNKVPDTA